MRRILVLVAVALAACDSSHQASAAGEVIGAPVGDISPPARRWCAPSRQRRAHRGAGRHRRRAIRGARRRLIAPLLRDPRAVRPRLLVVAARAAAGWDGWPEVDKLLAGEPWIDTQFEGEGRELLARSALERGADTRRAHAGVGSAPDAKTSRHSRDATRAHRARARAQQLLRQRGRGVRASGARALGVLAACATGSCCARRASSADSRRARRLRDRSLPRRPSRASHGPRHRHASDSATPLGAAQRYAALGATVQCAVACVCRWRPDSAARDAVKTRAARVHCAAGTAARTLAPRSTCSTRDSRCSRRPKSSIVARRRRGWAAGARGDRL